MDQQIQFGFPEIWDQVHSQYAAFFEAAKELEELTGQILQAAHAKALEPQDKSVFVLARLTAIGLMELLVLAANGCGQGAMKIARGMFESALYAEYLRRHPDEADDYIEFGRVILWKRYQWLKKNAPKAASRNPPADVRKLQEHFNRVKGRFTNRKGTLRNHWHKKSIAQMAQDTKRSTQFDLSYSIACSIHHASFEGLLSYFEGKGDEASFGLPPSMEWLDQALFFGHSCLLQALDTLNDCFKLGFDEGITKAAERFKEVWRKPTTKG